MINEEASHSSNKKGDAAAFVVRVKQVRIDEETHRLLTELGEFGESYDDVVARVAKHYMSCPEAKKEQRKRQHQ